MSIHLTERDWSPPFHGVSHRMIGGRQCTIVDYGPYAIEATVFGRRGSGSVQADAIDAPVRFATVAAARMWCEDVAGRLVGIGKSWERAE